MARDVEITPELLIQAYTVGMFPMAMDADDPQLHWIEPSWRCIIPLDGLKISRSLAKTVRQGRFDVRVNTAFDQVLDACAASAPGREKTWINTTIRQLYTALHRRGQVHSVECWREDALVGGLYGVSIGAAFFGESMFHRETDASKVALVHLVERLNAGGYVLLDAQFRTDHLVSLGAIEVPKLRYKAMLADAVRKNADFGR